MATPEIFPTLVSRDAQGSFTLCVLHTATILVFDWVLVWLSQVRLRPTDSLISLPPVALSQKHPLEAVRRHAALVLRLCVALWVGAAGWGALRGAQVVHERQSIFPTEVHKFDVADAWVKVDACWRENRISGDGTKTRPVFHPKYHKPVSYLHTWGWGTCWPGLGSAAGLQGGHKDNREYFGF